MYNELNNVFPNHTHFYEVSGMSMTEALEICARLSADDTHVVNYAGKIIFATKHNVESVDIPWLHPVAGSPADHVPLDSEPNQG